MLEVDLTTKPARMEPAELAPATPCGVKISWKKPASGGNAITSYKIEIRIARSLWIDAKGNPVKQLWYQ